MIETVGEETPSRLPEELDWTPPGPQLGTLLASINRQKLDAGDLLRLAQARARQVAHQEAQLLADLHAIARAVPDHGAQPGRRDDPGKYPWAEVEAAMALRWTNSRAGTQMIVADEVIDRLPAVHAALDAGEIDVPKVRIFVDLLMGLPDDRQARAIVNQVIDAAPRLTTGELRAKLRKLVLAIDPEIGKRRAKTGSVDRRVIAFGNENHLGVLSGHDLAPHRVAAVMQRLDAIAKAAKAGGDVRKLDQLRADAFIDLLAGEGLAAGGPVSDGSIEFPTGELSPEADAPWPAAPADPDLLTEPAPEPGQSPPDPEGPVDLWASGVPEPPAAVTEPVDAAQLALAAQQAQWLAQFPLLSTHNPMCLRCRTHTTETETAHVGETAHTSGPTERVAQADRGGPTGKVAQAERVEPAAMPGPRAGVVELQVPLATLIDLAQLPGELAGWGPVVADIAKQVATQMRNATWRFSIYDRPGELAYHGTTSKRPEPKPTQSPRKKRRTGRYPSAEVAAFVKARDRRCVAPGCRRAARGCDLDHTLDWVKGGESETCNLGLLCRRHHLLKHTTGCDLIQIESGVFVWSTPAGMQYVVTPDRPLIDEQDLAELSREPQPTRPSDEDLLANQVPDPRYLPADLALDTSQ